MVLSFVIIFADKKKTLATLIVAKKKKGWHPRARQHHGDVRPIFITDAASSAFLNGYL